MGRFDWLIFIEPECEIRTLWDWCMSRTVEHESYPCVGLLYWLSFPFISICPDGTVSYIPPAYFVLFMWAMLLIFIVYFIFNKR